MEKKLKGRAFRFEDGDGMFTIGCKTPEEALAVMKRDFYEWDHEELPAEMVLENVKEDWMYQHRACDGYYSIGENTCGACGETTRGNGRKTFTIYY